jgi:hypothetical protein
LSIWNHFMSFNISSFANSRGVFPSNYVVSCMKHPIFFKTSTQTTTFFILIHICCCQALFTCQRHKFFFVFGHTFLQSNKARETWYNNLRNIGNRLKWTTFSSQRSLCTHHLKSTQVSIWNAQYNPLKHKPLKLIRNINHWNLVQPLNPTWNINNWNLVWLKKPTQNINH